MSIYNPPNVSGYVTGATNSTLTLTGTTLGLNLSNANTWTGQQTFSTAPLQIGTSASGNNIDVNGTLGSELAPTLVTGNWTLGTGWSFGTSPDTIIKSADGTGAVTPTAATTIVANTLYKVVITLSAWSAGSAQFTLGGTTGEFNLTSATTFTGYVKTTTTGKLIINPTNTSRFTISSISIVPLTNNTGVANVYGDLNVKGVSTFSNRVTINGSTLQTQQLNIKGGIGLETTGTTETARRSGRIYYNTDIQNSGSGALYFEPDTNGTRLYFGRSDLSLRFNLNFGGVTNIESMPIFTMTDQMTLGASSGSSHNIGRVSDDLYLASGAPSAGGNTVFWNRNTYAGYSGSTETARFTSGNRMGIGTGATVSAKLHVISTTEQFRSGFDALNYWNATTSSTGGVTFDAVGSGAGFTFSDNVTVPRIVLSNANNYMERDSGTGATKIVSPIQSLLVQTNTAVNIFSVSNGLMTVDGVRLGVTDQPFPVSWSALPAFWNNEIQGLSYRPGVSTSGYAETLFTGQTIFSGTPITVTTQANVWIYGTPFKHPAGATISGEAYALLVTNGRTRLDGDLILGVAGNKINITEGTNASVGVVTLVAGTATVNTTAVTANSRIFLTRQTTAGTLGTSVDVTARVAGMSFTITSNGSILDTSTVGWIIIN